jgi:hypothetical protein
MVSLSVVGVCLRFFCHPTYLKISENFNESASIDVAQDVLGNWVGEVKKPVDDSGNTTMIKRQMDEALSEQLIQLIRQINSVERQIFLLTNEKLRLERELNYFLVGNDGIQDSRESSRQVV